MLKKWKVKRVDKERDRNTHSPPTDQGVLPTAYDIDQSRVPQSGMHVTTHQQQHVRIHDDKRITERRRQRNPELSLPRDGKFDNILQEICEAPPACLPKGFLGKEDIRSSGSTLPHYVAARGRLETVLLEVMLSSTYHGYSVDTLDEAGFTALHIAVKYDRIENVKLLLEAGAQFDTPNPYGELPLHVAIISSKDPDLVDKLLFRHCDSMDIPIVGSSERAGQTALDLVVERALREVPASGDAVFTPSIHRMLTAVLLRSTGTLDNPEFLQNHARTNHTMFLRAIIAIKRLWPLGAQRLVVTMRHALRLECKRRDWTCRCDAHLDHLLSSAPQGPISTNFKPGPSMRF